ncbi:DNA polymerase III subunit chi [Terricaulis sp.]|uniref:DNA polymerase III subunit chi n=1 Tax=Terricaulis sp. TaxID=2768686 RepID=UPI0037844A25
MAELWFYHLERSDIEQALPPLLEKCLQRGWRALVRGGSSDRLDALDSVLWTYRDESFLPHGRDNPERQPVYLTQDGGNPNGAQVLFLLDGAAAEDIASYERACLVFDGRDENATQLARARWKQAKDAGVAVSYWKESGAGKWEKQA